MDEMQYRGLRERMVTEQLEAKGIIDKRVLDAMRRVPRHLFVPTGLREESYSDHPLPIPGGQTISQPLMVAIMLQSACLTGMETVLEVGTGSGYQAALLAELVKSVVTIERLPQLAAGARDVLDSQGYASVVVVVGDGSLGWPGKAPYDRILIAAGSPAIPTPVVDQLDNNGKLIVPVGNFKEQKLIVVSKSAQGVVSRRSEGWCSFVPLIGKAAWKAPRTGSRSEME